MREFTAEYLATTREGMWADVRAPLEPLKLHSRDRVVDVGAGTGALTAVLREETGGEVVAVDADPELLARADSPQVIGDATGLPFADASVDLAACQALLVNLPDPAAAVRELGRVAGTVAAIEPDNAAVTVESTVETESTLAERARELYLAGVRTDASLGAVRDLFRAAGLSGIEVRRYDHERTVEPPYTERDIESTRRKASGAGLTADRAEVLAGGLSPAAFDELREQWRAMGRAAVEQMQREEYRRRETVPFYVTVGQAGEQ
ncbi:MAG: class I SAM-dependent methyltransferase [Salinirussus sp.]